MSARVWRDTKVLKMLLEFELLLVLA